MKSFKLVDLAGIDEGRFLAQADDELRQVQKVLAKFVEKHGDAAKGAKAELCLKVTLTCMKPDDHLFAVKGAISQKVPSRPPVITMAIADEDDEGEAALFMRQSGTDKSHPAQGKLCTADGRNIDPETGEIVDEPQPVDGKSRAAGEQ